MYDPPIFQFNIPPNIHRNLLSFVKYDLLKPKVAILREEGSNGDREMIYCFYEAGFDVYNVNLGDILDETINLNNFRGLVFVGGFSFSDVLGSAYGWYNSIVNNPKIKNQFDNFYNREDTFSLGVCNGCQLMSLLGWVENVSLEHNISGRFESRYSFVKIIENNCIFLKDMRGLSMGIWIAHGEGKICEKAENNNSYPIKYVDNFGNITEEYPCNPNGSSLGNAAICSANGRHLAMMPHPERCVLNWQLPWVSDNEKQNLNDIIKTPWMNMFYNTYNWCNNL
jgi:phosphoribosylformylglycinamidine synthase